MGLKSLKHVFEPLMSASSAQKFHGQNTSILTYVLGVKAWRCIKILKTSYKPFIT